MTKKIKHLCTIVQDGHQALSKKADSIALDEITSLETRKILDDMRCTLAGEPDGVAIAAPQIGVSKRIFVVKGSVFGENKPDIAFINPSIIKKSKKRLLLEEGCLSVRYIYGNVPRHTNVTIQAHLEDGTSIVRGAGGLLAHIFQHEIDHLDGILFTERAVETYHLTDEERTKLDTASKKAKDALYEKYQ